MATSGASLEQIYNRLSSVTPYHPLSADTFSDWSMEAGDIIRVTRDGKNYDSPVHSSSMNWKGQPRISVSSGGNETRENISRQTKRKYSRGGSGYRNDGFLHQELLDTYNGLYSYFEVTSSRMYVTFSGMYDGLSSHFEITRSRMAADFQGKYDGLSSHFEITRSRMEANFQSAYDGLSSAFEITRSRMAADFQGKYDGLSSHFEVTRSRMEANFQGVYDGLTSAFEITRSRMYADFQGKYDGLSSYFEVTRSRMAADFQGKYDGLSSYFEVTRSRMAADFQGKYDGLSSHFELTRSQLYVSINNTREELSSSIQAQANRISLVVEGTGSNSHIKPAVIQASINAATGQSKILLSADNVVVDGTLVTSKITADYISTKIQSLATLTAKNITANTITAGVNFVLPNGLNLSANGVWQVSLSQSGNTYTLKEMKLNGTERTIGTFSRATSLSGEWSSGHLEVTASPQNTKYHQYIISGTAEDVSSNNNLWYVPILAKSNPNSSSSTRTGLRVIVNATARYNAGWTDAAAKVTSLPPSSAQTGYYYSFTAPTSTVGGSKTHWIRMTPTDGDNDSMDMQYWLGTVSGVDQFRTVARTNHGKYTAGYNAGYAGAYPRLSYGNGLWQATKSDSSGTSAYYMKMESDSGFASDHTIKIYTKITPSPLTTKSEWSTAWTFTLDAINEWKSGYNTSHSMFQTGVTDDTPIYSAEINPGGSITLWPTFALKDSGHQYGSSCTVRCPATTVNSWSWDGLSFSDTTAKAWINYAVNVHVKVNGTTYSSSNLTTGKLWLKKNGIYAYLMRGSTIIGNLEIRTTEPT